MKRWIAALLASAFVLTAPAAAQTVGADFTRSRTYRNQFSDVAPGSAFYDHVAALYEYGLTQGRSDGTFGPAAPVTVGQLVTFAGRLRSLWQYGDAETGAGSAADGAAYRPYLAYLQTEGVLGGELDGRYAAAATRGETARVLANVLPDSALPEIAGELVADAYGCGKFITDVTASTAYRDDILELYRCGISRGSDARGSYLPAGTLTRGALAAMLTRMMDPALRSAPDWDITAAFSARGTTWGSLIGGTPAYLAEPVTEAAVAQDVAYMLSRGQRTLTLYYGGRLTANRVRWLMDTAMAEVKSYCEQGYNQVSCAYDLSSGKAVLTFSAASATDAQLSAYRAYTLSAAIAVHDELWRQGAISWTMSDYEKARVYYDWICRSCVYDAEAGDSSLSHTPYALFKNGTAVCDGYTGAYNLLLKLEGIDCWALVNSSHIWTVAELDGTQYHIDTTWGDSSGAGTDYTFFAMTASQSWGYHTW
ncbi:MAG: S-layer homology domain-containing protein [Oscillibacter sp.]|jgi:hypothetical protein|nr:S-layer homology domain-containing protein [Oscillibacter sp.]